MLHVSKNIILSFLFTECWTRIKWYTALGWRFKRSLRVRCTYVLKTTNLYLFFSFITPLNRKRQRLTIFASYFSHLCQPILCTDGAGNALCVFVLNYDTYTGAHVANQSRESTWYKDMSLCHGLAQNIYNCALYTCVLQIKRDL